MDFNIEVRKKQLQSLDQYISSSKDKVQSILDYLGWNSKRVLESETKTVCSLNHNHQIPSKCINEHLKKCYLKTAGYDVDEIFLPDPLHDSTSSIKLDNTKKMEILGQARYNSLKFRAAWNGQDSDPITSDRYFTTFSSDERLALYDYCVKNTESPPVPSEFNIHIDDKKEEKLLTQEELLVKERDAKRRRAKYKSVHTGRNKSYTEVIKEVIENQMELYKEYLIKSSVNNTDPYAIQRENNQHMQYASNDYIQQSDLNEYEDKEETERPCSSVSRHSAQSGSSRSKRDYDFCKNDDNNRRQQCKDYNNKKHDRREHNPYKEKRKYVDHKDSREYSRDRKERHYKLERRH